MGIQRTKKEISVTFDWGLAKSIMTTTLIAGKFLAGAPVKKLLVFFYIMCSAKLAGQVCQKLADS